MDVNLLIEAFQQMEVLVDAADFDTVGSKLVDNYLLVKFKQIVNAD